MSKGESTNRRASAVIQAPTLTAEQFVEKLRQALRRNGDFPASAKVVTELRELVSKPKTTANQITEIILREPSLGTRVLHLVNSSFYRRAKPIMTVSQAVVQVGMRPLAELCAGLVLLQKFIPAARKGGAFADCLKQTITTALLTSSICSVDNDKGKQQKGETGYLAGTFYELGSLLLAYYFPNIYESALQRAKQKDQPLAQSIQELTGLSPVRLSLEVIDALGLPEFYKDVVQSAGDDETLASMNLTRDQSSLMARALYVSHEISTELSQEGDKQDLAERIEALAKRSGIPAKDIGSVLTALPERFQDHCSSLDLHLPSLPTYITSMNPTAGAGTAPETQIFTIDAEFESFVDEIRQAVENRESTASIVTSVMETFAWSLGFDRVLLMLVTKGKRTLAGRMLLGDFPGFDPKTFERPVENTSQPYAVDTQALREGRPIFTGDPVFDEGWPCVAVPIGFGKRTIGILYADRSSPDAKELTGQEQAAIGVLAELLDRSITTTG